MLLLVFFSTVSEAYRFLKSLISCICVRILYFFSFLTEYYQVTDVVTIPRNHRLILIFFCDYCGCSVCVRRCSSPIPNFLRLLCLFHSFAISLLRSRSVADVSDFSFLRLRYVFYFYLGRFMACLQAIYINT